MEDKTTSPKTTKWKRKVFPNIKLSENGLRKESTEKMKALQHRTEGDADFIYTPGQWGTGGTNQGHNQAGDARGTSKRGERRAFISNFNQCSISIHLVPVVLGEKTDEVVPHGCDPTGSAPPLLKGFYSKDVFPLK